MDEQDKTIEGTYRVIDSDGRPMPQPFWGPNAKSVAAQIIVWAAFCAILNWITGLVLGR